MINHLITWGLEKETIVLEKSVEKVLNFGSKYLYEQVPYLLFNKERGNWDFYLKPKNVIQNKTKLIKKQTNTTTTTKKKKCENI